MVSGVTRTSSLFFSFRGRNVPVTVSAGVTDEEAAMAIASGPFTTWYQRCEEETDGKRIDIHSVEIQSVDLFGARVVGFVKIKADCTLVDGETHHEHRLPGICFLRGNAVAIFFALYCEDGQVYSLLVDQPRIPIGRVSCLEIPAGMIDNENESIAGIAVKEMEEECGIKIKVRYEISQTILLLHQLSSISPLYSQSYPAVRSCRSYRTRVPRRVLCGTCTDSRRVPVTGWLR
jgi:ADP-sugar diphosphatase